MAWQYTPEVLPFIGVLFLSMFIAGGLAVYTVVVRTEVIDEPSVQAFVGLNVGSALWSGAYAMQLVSRDVQTKQVWLTVAFIGAILVVFSTFLFAIAYSGNERWLRRRPLLLLLLEPVIAFVLFLTQYRGLYTQDVGTETVANLVVLDRTFGPMAIIHILYLYALLAVGAGLLLRTMYRSEYLYREQAAAVLIAILVPLFANVIWFLGLGPLGNLDLTSVAFVVSGLMFAIAIYRHHLLDIVPVARTAVVENMRDGFLVIDELNRVRDVNAAIRTSFSTTDTAAIIGRDVTELFPEVAPLVRDRASNGRTEIVIGDGDTRRFFDVQCQNLSSDSEFQLLLLRDVTKQYAVEQRYQSLIENASDLITVIDEDGVVLYQSLSITNVLGYEPSDIEGQSYLSFVH